jgi:predicted RNA-binding protein associated with RNAse of E/G family
MSNRILTRTATASLQWKTADLCIDLHCACGADTHVCDQMDDTIICPRCGQWYVLGHTVTATRRTPDV